MKFLGLLGLLFFISSAFANKLDAQVVRVGLYDFTPYVFLDDEPSGIAIEMLNRMNQFQKRYQFVPVLTTSRRRYHDFSNKKFDMMMFEDKNWGWQSFLVNQSEPYVTDAEVYVTQATGNRGQSYFDSFDDKLMVGVLGYHYKFAEFNSDLGYLKKHFNFIPTQNQAQSLELILKKRGDIAVISKSYLNYHFRQFPDDKQKLLISDKHDQTYRHTILIRQGHIISLDFINQLLLKMKEENQLAPLWQRFGLVEIRSHE